MKKTNALGRIWIIERWFEYNNTWGFSVFAEEFYTTRQEARNKIKELKKVYCLGNSQFRIHEYYPW